MHIKHYHPALLKKLGCKTLRVEDLATARTAFETDDIKPQVGLDFYDDSFFFQLFSA